MNIFRRKKLIPTPEEALDFAIRDILVKLDSLYEMYEPEVVISTLLTHIQHTSRVAHSGISNLQVSEVMYQIADDYATKEEVESPTQK